MSTTPNYYGDHTTVESTDRPVNDQLDAFARLLWLSSDPFAADGPPWEAMPEVWRQNWRDLARDPEAVEAIGWSRSVDYTVVWSPSLYGDHTTVESTDRSLGRRMADLAKEKTRLERLLAEREARLVEVERRVVVAEMIVDRVAAEAPGATIERLEERVAALSQEKLEILALARDNALPHATRIMGILCKEAGRAYRRRMEVGRPPPDLPAQRIHVAALEVEAGIARGSASHHVRPLVARGHFQYHVQAADVHPDKGPPRSVSLISPGDGTLHEMEDLRRKKERDKKAQDKADRLAREARDQARLAELEQAAANAADGCRLCGGRLLPTGYHCADCGDAPEPRTLAAMPRLIVVGSYGHHTKPAKLDQYISRSMAVDSTDRALRPRIAPPLLYGVSGKDPF